MKATGIKSAQLIRNTFPPSATNCSHQPQHACRLVAVNTSPLSIGTRALDSIQAGVSPNSKLSLSIAVTQRSNPQTMEAETIADSESAKFSANNIMVWYLGGNHAARLLTSVDGDLDPDVLAKLATVPSVVGELALSVESLVSDDFTVGGFEHELLAQIAENTLNSRRASITASTTTVSQTPTVTNESRKVSSPSSNIALDDEAHSSETTSPTGISKLSVPNPLLNKFDPVPNPLARITPPGSPTPITESIHSGKRKNCPTSRDESHLPPMKSMKGSHQDETRNMHPQ